MHHRLYNAIFILVCLLFCLPAAQAQTLRVITYNIYHGEENYNRGQSNLARIAALINQYKPHVVFLQEVDSMTGRSGRVNNGVPQNQVAVLAELTGMYGYFAKAIDYDGGGYGEGLLLRQPQQFITTALPVPLGGEGRALAGAVIRVKGKSIAVGGTHLCHEKNENRVAQTHATIDYFASMAMPVVVGGDMNFEPHSEPYRIITKSYTDAAVAYGNPQNTYSVKEPTKRIDYFFLSNKHRWKVKKLVRIDADPSDHFGLFVKLRLKS